MAKTVLIVEDNELNMKLFHDLLEAHGYQIVGTRNGIIIDPEHLGVRDGASSSYGADAIAGVVNIITKRSFQGIAGRDGAW